MVAAHNADLVAAHDCGLQTAFVARPTERDVIADPDVDLSADDFEDLASKLDC